MLELQFSRPGAPLSILCIGAHSDDIEIGCGGALLRWLAERSGTQVRWVVLSSGAAGGQRADEARASAREWLPENGGEVEIGPFRDAYMPWQGAEVKDYFEGLAKRVQPDLVLTHQRGDLHQDHRLIGELTWNTFRNHLILEYEIPKYDGGLVQPTFYVPLAAEVVTRKIDRLMKHFGSQRSKRWFDAEVFRGLMRLRGMECNSPSGYAEAFHVAKIVL